MPGGRPGFPGVAGHKAQTKSRGRRDHGSCRGHPVQAAAGAPRPARRRAAKPAAAARSTRPALLGSGTAETGEFGMASKAVVLPPVTSMGWVLKMNRSKNMSLSRVWIVKDRTLPTLAAETVKFGGFAGVSAVPSSRVAL